MTDGVVEGSVKVVAFCPPRVVVPPLELIMVPLPDVVLFATVTVVELVGITVVGGGVTVVMVVPLLVVEVLQRKIVSWHSRMKRGTVARNIHCDNRTRARARRTAASPIHGLGLASWHHSCDKQRDGGLGVHHIGGLADSKS